MVQNSNNVLAARPILRGPERPLITAVAPPPARVEDERAGPGLAQSPCPARRALIVLGMHRSGTSSLTRVLSLAGATLPAHILPAGDGLPNDGNTQAGFWESKPLMLLHEEILASADSAWDDLADIHPSWFDSKVARAFKHRLIETLEMEFDVAPCFVAKDPRISRLAPLWQAALEAMDVEANWLIAVRNPFEVAASLTARDRFSQPKGLLLWLSYFLAAEKHTRGQQRLFVQYDQVLDDWRGVLDRIEEHFDLPFPRLSRRAAAETDDFLDRSLRHHTLPLTGRTSRQDLIGLARWTSRWANRAAKGEPGTVAPLDEIHQALQQAASVYGPLLASAELEARKIQEQEAHLASKLEQLQTALTEQGRALARTQTQVETLHRQISESWAMGQRREDQQHRTEARIGEVANDLEQRRDTNATELESEHRFLAQEREDLIRRVRRLEGRIDGLHLAVANRVVPPSRQPKLVAEA
ncbi:MAG: hypothetical protein AAF657_03845 [Acidobacteriota bacterium]